MFEVGNANIYRVKIWKHSILFCFDYANAFEEKLRKYRNVSP